MKKFIACLFPLMFFCCLPVEEEDTSGYNCTPDGCFGDSVDAQYLTLADCQTACEDTYNNDGDGDGDGDGSWWWNITINGDTYAAGNNNDCLQDQVAGSAQMLMGNLSIGFSMADLTSPYYIEGDYIALSFMITNPYEGFNTAQLSATSAVSGNSFFNYFGEMGSFSSVSGLTYYEAMNNNNDAHMVNIEISSLAQPYTLCTDNIEGSVSITLYAIDPGSDGDPSSFDLLNDIHSIPVELEISFSVPRNM
jgi:hypothetical protein